jgi:hypothetical protein
MNNSQYPCRAGCNQKSEPLQITLAAWSIGRIKVKPEADDEQFSILQKKPSRFDGGMVWPFGHKAQQ